MPKHHRKFITTPVVVVVFLFFSTGCFFLSVLLNTESESSQRVPPTTTATSTHSQQSSSLPAHSRVKNTTSGNRKKNIVILLQQSPVNGKNQLQRLQVIDDGWAKWTMLSLSQVSVYAAIDNDNDNDAQKNRNILFKNIRIIRHQRHTSDRKITENDDRPLENMIHSFATLALFHPLEWLVFANDHTFMIPPNLQCFLSKWDAHVPIYSGNKLIRGTHRSFNLYFASGGAGVIVSHTALKMFLLALVIGHDQYINTFMTLHMKDGTLIQLLTTWTKKGKSSDSTDDVHFSFVNAMIALYEWRTQGKSLPSVFKIILSPHRVVILRDHSLPSHLLTSSSATAATESPATLPNSLQLLHQQSSTSSSNMKEIQWTWFDHSNHHRLPQEISSYTMLQLSACIPQTMWERSNPGLVLAYCLQAVFNTPFPATNDSNVISPSKNKMFIAIFLLLLFKPFLSFLFCDMIFQSEVFLYAHLPNPHPTYSREIAGGERFNVYGLLRTLRGDTDPWYTGNITIEIIAIRSHFFSFVSSIQNTCSFTLTPTLFCIVQTMYVECKLALRPGSLKGPQASVPFLFPMARDVISWHYVSEHESLLLYKILSSRYPELSVVSLADITTKTSGTMSSQELLQRWPHTTKDIGPYSVKMFDQQEASRVITFLYQHIIIRSTI